MTSDGFEWVKSPQVIADGLEKYGQKALVALQAVANFWGRHIQDEARKEAGWFDRTGNARSGLFYAVDGFGLSQLVGEVTAEAQSEKTDVTIESGDDETLIVTLGHTVFYGKFLELSNGGKYAVIMSTIESNLPMLGRMVQDAFKG